MGKSPQNHLCPPFVHIKNSSSATTLIHLAVIINQMYPTMYATALLLDTDRVSPREQEVLELLSNGLSSTEIASQLYLSSHTVNDHRKALKQKLRARNAAEMIRRGFELQLLHLSTYSS